MADKQESEAPAEVVEDRRAEDQDAAIQAALEAAILPEEDRRTPEPEPAPQPVAPSKPEAGQNDDLHVVRDRGDGVKVNAFGQIITS